MGLDMWLMGEKSWHGAVRRREDSFPVEKLILELGYWRKHYDLHDAMLANYKDSFGAEDLRRLLQVIEGGFQKGPKCNRKKTKEEQPRTLEILASAIKWKEAAPDGELRFIRYHWIS